MLKLMNTRNRATISPAIHAIIIAIITHGAGTRR
jgi:hypothetical protein